jgi:hypothetical protein
MYRRMRKKNEIKLNHIELLLVPFVITNLNENQFNKKKKTIS